MRISQIKTLCWLGNGLVLVGAAYVGLHFWQTFESRGKVAQVEWPDTGGKGAIERRWPGAVTGFTAIWSTPVNGLVPKPPEKTEGPRVPTDPSKIFLAKFQLMTVWTDEGDPFRSVAFLKSSGGSKDAGLLPVRTGERLDGFTFVGIETERGLPTLLFTHPEIEKPVRMSLSGSPDQTLARAGERLVRELAAATAIAKPVTDPSRIERPAFRDIVSDPSGLTWRMPKEETAWWEDFGEERVLAKLAVQNKQDADGRPVGVTLRSQPGQGTPVGEGRGLGVNDTIKAVNGVPIGTKEDILRYLRGEGRGLTRYEVLVEDETGRERTVVYIIERYARS